MLNHIPIFFIMICYIIYGTVSKSIEHGKVRNKVNKKCNYNFLCVSKVLYSKKNK